MRPALATVAIVFALGGAVPAAALALAFAGVHAARSPDRLLDAAYVLAFCGIGYIAG